MPRGTKRNHDGDPTMTVGDEKIRKKIDKKSVVKDEVAMLTVNKPTNEARCLSKRKIKNSQRTDFIYDITTSKSVKNQNDLNNDAQIAVPAQKTSGSRPDKHKGVSKSVYCGSRKKQKGCDKLSHPEQGNLVDTSLSTNVLKYSIDIPKLWRDCSIAMQ